jgi:hypothetical protein
LAVVCWQLSGNTNTNVLIWQFEDLKMKYIGLAGTPTKGKKNTS